MLPFLSLFCFLGFECFSYKVSFFVIFLGHFAFDNIQLVNIIPKTFLFYIIKKHYKPKTNKKSNSGSTCFAHKLVVAYWNGLEFL
jgi:hypothetical protein